MSRRDEQEEWLRRSQAALRTASGTGSEESIPAGASAEPGREASRVAFEGVEPLCPRCGRVLVKPLAHWLEGAEGLGRVVRVACVPACGWSGVAQFARRQDLQEPVS